MCYSAQLKERFREFVRTTGARMDIHEFAKLYGMKIIAGATPIPRAVG